jgi:hypothetical protein
MALFGRPIHVEARARHPNLEMSGQHLPADTLAMDNRKVGMAAPYDKLGTDPTERAQPAARGLSESDARSIIGRQSALTIGLG